MSFSMHIHYGNVPYGNVPYGNVPYAINNHYLIELYIYV